MTADPQPVDQPPECYRHPGRVTYIRCQRCNRPICPDCAIPAAVGVQCPECVRAGNQNVPQPRTTFGGILRPDSAPVITYTLIGICVAVWLLQQIDSLNVTNRFAMVGWALETANGPIIGVADGEYYRLITAAFLHDPSSPVHLLVNMVALYMLGPPLERLFGRVRFLAIYLVSAVGGAATSYLLLSPVATGVGASGAIFGLFGAMIVVSRRMKYDLRPIIVILVINAVIGFRFSNIDWRAHLGGLISGALVSLAMVYAPREHRTLVQVTGTVLVLALAAVVVIVRTNALLG